MDGQRRADELGQAPLVGHVYVLVALLLHERASLPLGGDGGEAGEQRVTLSLAHNPRPAQRARIRLAAPQVLKQLTQRVASEQRISTRRAPRARGDGPLTSSR